MAIGNLQPSYMPDTYTIFAVIILTKEVDMLLLYACFCYLTLGSTWEMIYIDILIGWLLAA